jgi:hypothetical protein
MLCTLTELGHIDFFSGDGGFSRRPVALARFAQTLFAVSMIVPLCKGVSTAQRSPAALLRKVRRRPDRLARRQIRLIVTRLS